ncbi:PLP-dependent aminotransferase family protein [Rhizobium rhizogenes]|uniref:MocR-like transcription factor YczR n=1 Tax=Rhizobium rhizogenes TaxID=359 RepID=UPI003865B0FD
MASNSLSAHSLARLLGQWRGASSSEPAYRLLANALRMLIIDGRVAVGVRLAGEREFSRSIGVSRTTISAAYDQLRDAGYLLSKRGSGSITRLPVAHSTSDQFVETEGPMRSIDWTSAALPAPAGMWHAYEEALARLPGWLSGIGYETLGIPCLREAIARDYDRRGCPTQPDQILVTSGAQSGLSLILRALAGPGDRVVVEHPTYHNALSAILRNNCQPVPVGFPDDGWDLGALAAAIRQTRPRLAYLIPDFHVPTGRLMGEQSRRDLVATAKETRTPIVIDETMAETGFDTRTVPPVASNDPEGHTIITIGSASKRFWGGLRIGWIRASEQRIAEFCRLRAVLDMATPVLEQLALTVLFERDAGATERRRTLRARCDRLAALLSEALSDWKVTIPDGGLSLWVELPWPGATAITATSHSMGLRLGAGPRFGLDGAFERFLRLPFTLSETEISVAVDRLARADAHLRRRSGNSFSSPLWDVDSMRLI